MLGIVCSLCTSFQGLKGHRGSSCQVLVGNRLFFSCRCQTFREPGLRLSAIICFVRPFRTSRESGAPAVGLCLFSSGLMGQRSFSCRLLCVFPSVLFAPKGTSRAPDAGIVHTFLASRDIGAPAIGYCLFFLSVHFRPRGTLGLQLSGIVWSFCLSSGARGILKLQLSSNCLFFLSADFRP